MDGISAAPAGVPTGVVAPPVVSLRDAAARDVRVTGSKAASLARAAEAGLPALPGFAVTTEGHRRFLAAGRRLDGELRAQLLAPWSELSARGERSLVVRSSSTVEDAGSSSMAGRFRSVLDVRGWDAFADAVVAVLSSADAVAAAERTAEPSPMGVLVQPYLAVARGGVLFGVDPVTGDERRLVAEAVAGGPEALVSGTVTAQHYATTRRGRLLEVDHRPRHLLRPGRADRLLAAGDLRALARLAARAAAVFGGPQDVEWAIESGTVYLLQSRPVTTL